MFNKFLRHDFGAENKNKIKAMKHSKLFVTTHLFIIFGKYTLNAKYMKVAFKKIVHY